MSHKTTGMVTILSTVLIKVVLETKSGFVLNCTASKVVFAAVGMAASKIMICFVIGSTGRMSVNKTAISGEMSSRNMSEMETFGISIRRKEMTASCIPSTIIIVGIAASPTSFTHVMTPAGIGICINCKTIPSSAP